MPRFLLIQEYQDYRFLEIYVLHKSLYCHSFCLKILYCILQFLDYYCYFNFFHINLNYYLFDHYYIHFYILVQEGNFISFFCLSRNFNPMKKAKT